MMACCEGCRDHAARAGLRLEKDPQPGALRLDIAARAYLGVPFLHQGRNPKVGIDCVGLLVLAARDCGASDVASYDLTGYGRNPHSGALERQLMAAMDEPVCYVSPGCVVSIDFKGQTRHVAIVGEHPYGLSLIHTASNVGRVIEHGLSETWRKRITGAYRIEVAA